MSMKSITFGGHPVKRITINGGLFFERPPIDAVPIKPSSSLFPMKMMAGDFPTYAVRVGSEYGYYDPLNDRFSAVSALTGDDLVRCEYVSTEGSSYVDTGLKLGGTDELMIDFLYTSTGKNICGSFTSGNVNVYSFYASTSSSYVRYGSTLYRGLPVSANTRHVFRMTPDGAYIDGTKYNSWSQTTFQSTANCWVCGLPNSTSAKMSGNVWEFEIAGRCHLIPVKVGSTYYLFDILRWEIPTHSGAFGGGPATGEPIPFPVS